jgi:two-component system chemotaxis response regulator CheB
VAAVSGIGHSNPRAEPALAIVAIGMSAGGLWPFRTLVRALPDGFCGAIVVAHHVSANSVLPMLIRAWTGGEAVFAESGAMLREGVIYVCPAQHHVIVNADATLTLSIRERIAHVRPSIDWLFETAAASYGPRALGVVLSGANGDGTRGAEHIARAGGRVIVQEPDSCERPEMPLSVIRSGVLHERRRPHELATALARHIEHVRTVHERAWSDPFGAEPLAAESRLD